jgi:hypothetical protein
MATSDELDPRVRLILVITLRNSVQIRSGVTAAEVKRNTVTGELKGIEWTLNDDPFGTSISWVDLGEVVAVHFEREERTPSVLVTVPADTASLDTPN